jgi:predicted peptidase
MARLTWLALFAFGCGSSAQLTKNFSLSSGADRYYTYAPDDWSAARAWPVIVFLHGSAERGHDPIAPTRVGLGPLLRARSGAFPAVVVFPQAPPGTMWGMPANNAAVLRILDEVIARYHGDPTRVYLTGNSLGGYGTFFLGALHPERFAALVPICGGVRGRAPSRDAPFADVPEDRRAEEVARRIGDTPTWIFHGARDRVVPVSGSREMYRAMQKTSHDVRYTEFPELGHRSWDRGYAMPGLFEWLLAQRR